MQISLGAIHLKPAVQTYLFLFENGDIISDQKAISEFQKISLSKLC